MMQTHSTRRDFFRLAGAAGGTGIGFSGSIASGQVNGAVPSSLKSNPYVRLIGHTIVSNSPGRRHRAFPTGVRLPNGELLVGFRVGSDHHMTHDGSFHITRSTDHGRTWQTPWCLCAEPGWDVCANIGQYPDGVLPSAEPFLHAVLRMYRWVAQPAPGQDYRENISFWTVSRDLGQNWEPMFPLADKTVVEVQTDRGPMKFWGISPHSYNSTLHRLSDGRIMGLFSGRSDPMPYRRHAEMGEARQPPDYALAGFSSDNLKSWTYRIIADSSGGIGFSESDSVRLPGGRYVAIYGNNAGSPWFFETHSDDEGQSWSPMRQLNFRGDSPSMIRLRSGALLAAIRSMPERGRGKIGIGLVVSPDEGQTWDLLGNVHDQTNWDMGYPDLVRLANGQILCLYYTGNERQPIPKELEEKLAATEPLRAIFKGKIRPAAFGEIQSEIRGAFLEEL